MKRQEDKVYLNFLVDMDLIKKINAYWHEHGFPNRATAIRHLLELGLEKGAKK